MKVRWRRWLLIGLGTWLLLVLVAPMLASTGWVRGKIEELLSEEAGTPVTIGALSIGWWSPLEIEGVRLAVEKGEFAGSELATLRSARISPGLLGWIGGPDLIEVDVDGLVVTIEERAGLRTNLDALLARHLPTEKAVRDVAPPEPRRELEPGPTMRVRITDSRVEIRRLAFQPPTERINPFRSDVPIRSLDEGLDIYSVEAGLLELDGTGSGLALRADVAVLHGADRATLKADLQFAGETIGGQLDIEGFDLDLLDPLVPARLDGRITLHAAGQFHPGRSHGEITLDIANLATDTIDEEWVKGRLEVEESAEELRFAKVELSSASGRFATAGNLILNKDEPYRPSGQLKGTAPLGPLYQIIAHSQPAPNAQVRFDLTTNLSPTGGRVDGLVHLDHFTGNDLPAEVTLRFALQGERATRKLVIDSFALRSAFARADLKGTIIRPPHFSADLSGEASGDIERLLQLAADFDPSLADLHAEGHGRVRIRTLQRRPDGELNLVVHAGVERLRLATDDEAPTEFLDVQADFDGTFFDNLDRLELRAAAVRDVHLKGTFQGLRTADGMIACDAELAGSLPLTQRLVELLDLPIVAPRVQPRFRATIQGDGTQLRTTGTVAAQGLELRIRGVEYSDPQVDADWKLAFDGDALRGSASLRGETLTLSLSKLGYGIESRALTAAGSFYLRDAAPLRRMLMDDATDWRGEHNADFELEQAPGRFSVKGRLHAPKLVFLYDGHGIDSLETTVDARVAYDGRHWSLTGTELRVPGLDLRATAEQLRFGSDEPARIDASTRLEHFARYVPDTAGALDLSVVRAADGKLRVDADCADFAYAGRSYGAMNVIVKDAELGSRVRLPSVALIAGSGATVQAHGEIGDEVRAHVSSKGTDFNTLARLVPQIDGKGAYRFDLDAVIPLGDSVSRFELEGSGSVEHLEASGQFIDGLAFTVDADCFLRKGALDDLRLEGSLRARKAKTAAVEWTDVEFQNEGRGSLRLDGSGAGHRFSKLLVSAKHIQIPDRAMEGIRVDGRGVLHRPDLHHEDAIEIYGDVQFKKIQAMVLDWVNGTARVSFAKQVLVLDELSTTANGGTVTGHARIDLHREIVPWSAKLVVKDAHLTTGVTDPLSYVLPILRLSGKDEAAKGFVTSVVELSASGTEWKQIQKSLRGKGSLQLREAEITGSLLMPLLSLRIGRLLLNKPYKIPDSTMTWNVKNGLVTTQPLKLGGKPFSISLAGTVKLTGELNYIIHPGILLVPLRVSGTWDKLSVRPAPTEALPKWPWNK